MSNWDLHCHLGGMHGFQARALYPKLRLMVHNLWYRWWWWTVVVVLGFASLLLLLFEPTAICLLSHQLNETNYCVIPRNLLTWIERLAQKHDSPSFADLHLIRWHLSIEFVIVPQLSCLVDDCLNEHWSYGGQHSKEELALNLVGSSPTIRHIPQEGLELACLWPNRLDA